MVIVFNDRGWTIVASQWAFGETPASTETKICYTWGADGTPAMEYQVIVKSSPADMIQYIKTNTDNGVCDLRSLQ